MLILKGKPFHRIVIYLDAADPVSRDGRNQQRKRHNQLRLPYGYNGHGVEKRRQQAMTSRFMRRIGAEIIQRFLRHKHDVGGQAVIEGDSEQLVRLVQGAVDTTDPLRIIDKAMMPGMTEIGNRFSRGSPSRRGYRSNHRFRNNRIYCCSRLLSACPRAGPRKCHSS